MVTRAKIVVRILAVAIVVINIVAVFEKLSKGSPIGFGVWMTLILLPFVGYLFLFLIPTLRITFSPKGISAYWKVGFGPLKIWEQTDYHIEWDSLLRVGSILPTWLPFHFIGVIGHQGSKSRMFYLGVFTTRKKESLIYVADHVRPNIIEENVQKLIEKYRLELDTKRARAT